MDSTLALLVRWDEGQASVAAVPGKDGEFGDATILDEDLDVTALELATDGAGRAIAGWQTSSGCRPTTFSSTRDSSGAWVAKVSLEGAQLAGVATAPNQGAVVLTQKLTATSSSVCAASGVQLHSISTSGVSPTLVDASPEALEPAFAVAPDGRVLVAWSRAGVVVAKWLAPPL